MTREIEEVDGDPVVRLPTDWSGEVDVEQISEDVVSIRRRTDSRSLPVSIETRRHPVLVDVHYGKSAVVPTPVDAVRYGYEKSTYRVRFYYLSLEAEPRWVKITEKNDEHEQGIYKFVDRWVEEGRITAEMAEWAKHQFE